MQPARLDLGMPARTPQAKQQDRASILLRKLSWYRARLAAMSAGEVAHRLLEQAKRNGSRWLQPDFTALAGDGPLPTLPGLAEGLADLRNAPGLSEQWTAIRSQAASGRFHRLGMDWPAHIRAARWHLDPVTGRSWPRDRYCFDIPYRHTGGLGDIKYVWEVNRLQHLQPMAALATVSRDAALAAECVAEIESWIEANPPFHGVNWISGIELSLRAISIITVLSLLPADAVPAELHQRIRTTLAAHGYWLLRYPSRFSSANNHLIAEAAGLFLIGRLTPGLRDGDAWTHFGRRTLLEECLRQIHSDGVGAEQSPTYTAFTLEFLMLAGCVADRLGEPFPDVYWKRIEAAGECLRWFTDSAGQQPRIGDDDEGRVFISQPEPEAYVSSILAGLAKLRRRPDIAPPVVVPHLRHAVFGLERANPAPLHGVRRFAEGGYTVFRSGDGEAESLLAFDHGPLGHLSIAAHGHADTLAVWLHVGGQPVLVDAGTYLYHSGGEHRSHLRGTGAHNTLSIDGTDSSRMSGPFNWSSKAAATVIDARITTPDGSLVEAEHDGYVRSHGTRHQRRVEQRGRAIIVTDRLIGAAQPLAVQIGFLIHPALTVTRDDTGWVIGGPAAPLVHIDGGSPLKGVVEMGVEPLGGGWYSPGFGQLQPAARLAFRGRMGEADTCRFTIRILAGSAAHDGDSA